MEPGQQHLFKFISGLPPESVKPVGLDSTAGAGPAPQIVPYIYEDSFASQTSPKESMWTGQGGGTYSSESEALASRGPKQFSTINVIENFKWSHSPRTAMINDNNDIPVIKLMEHTILQNVALNSILYNIAAVTDLNPELVNDGVDTTVKAVDWATGAVGGAVGTVSAYSQAISNVVGSRVKKALKTLKSQNTDESLKYTTSYQKPYHRLYATAPTGFKYKFPYFSDTYKYAAPGFSDTSGHTNLPFQKSAGNISEFASSVVSAFNTGTSGTYVEHPKYPAFPSDTKSYEFSFPLLNTVSMEDTQRNWELVFMLMYQNTPNRLTRTAIAPPHIYEANIPGVWYSRYAYMSRVEITMVGSRRLMELSLDESVGKLDERGLKDRNTIQVLVPDAYQISITMSELIPESRNYMMEMLRMGELIEVVDPTDGDTRTGQAVSGGIVAEVDQEVENLKFIGPRRPKG